MDDIRRVQDYEHLKILADPRRLVILRLLMADALTLSHLGEILGEHPAQIRHHLKLLEKAGLVELVDTRVVRGFVEKYYRARARAFIFHDLILPDGGEREIVALLGSHDLALEITSQQLRQCSAGRVDLLLVPVGSLEGLIALRQGIAQLASCHLLDAESGEYNLPTVRHLFPDRQMTLVTMAERQQGLLTLPGNPKSIHGLEDLARPEVTIVNRNRGSGTRLWFDRCLSQLGLPAQAVSGYEWEERTHTAVAEAIRNGDADTGLGLEAAARRYKLDFIPLFQERFDLVFSTEQASNPKLQPLLDYLQSAAFRQLLENLGGYSTRHSGDLIRSEGSL